jgi:hypothetical protein
MSIEEFLIEKLGQALEPFPVLLEEPEHDPRPSMDPAEYYVLQKTGSNWNDHIIDSTIAIQSYAGTRLRTIQLNEALKDAVEDLLQYDEIIGIELNSDYDFTDTSTRRPRYQAVFVITHYDLG